MIAIHNSGDFAPRWIAYCEANNIPYKLVNCFDNNIVKQLEGCKALMWHHHHNSYKDVIAAKRILSALQHAGIKVFPDFNTGWHFDDKVAQKYLLEAIEAPIVPSYVFYDKNEALEWANTTSYPKVFKLKGGAGSANVRLVKSKSECVRLIHQAFGKGFSQFDGKAYFRDMYKRYLAGNKTLTDVIRAFGRVFIPSEYAKRAPREKNYIYLQDFIPNNDHDIRIIVIGNKAFAIKRMVLRNDFRASGSGNIIYDISQIPLAYIKLAFELNKKIQSQCIAFDFVFDENGNPYVVEISYGFTPRVYEPCKGYWTDDLQFHPGSFNPYGWMVQNLYDSIIE